MNYKEMKSRIKEIEKERNTLARERDDLQRQVNAVEEESRNEKYDAIVGKYYERKDGEYIKGNYCDKLYAFKVIDNDIFKDQFHILKIDLAYAHRRNSFAYIGLDNCRLFSIDSNSMMYSKDDKSIIDKFEEITKERFKEIFGECVEHLREAIDYEESY